MVAVYAGVRETRCPADSVDVRVTAAVVSSFLALLALTGCAPGADGELRALIDEVALPQSSNFACEWGASSFESEPRSWYGCWDYVSDNRDRVSYRLRMRLAAAGFDVAVRANGPSAELTGIRGLKTVCVDVLPRGFAHGRNTAPSEVEIDAGEVFVDMWTVEWDAPRRADAVGSCPPLPN